MAGLSIYFTPACWCIFSAVQPVPNVLFLGQSGCLVLSGTLAQPSTRIRSICENFAFSSMTRLCQCGCCSLQSHLHSPGGGVWALRLQLSDVLSSPTSLISQKVCFRLAPLVRDSLFVASSRLPTLVVPCSHLCLLPSLFINLILWQDAVWRTLGSASRQKACSGLNVAG